MSTDYTALQFELAYFIKKSCFDYTPQWVRGNPSSYIDSVTFPKVLADKEYTYRVQSGDRNLGERSIILVACFKVAYTKMGVGVKPSYSVAPDGSQKVNLLEYNKGYGIADSTRIEIYVIDPSTEEEYLIAQWN